MSKGKKSHLKRCEYSGGCSTFIERSNKSKYCAVHEDLLNRIARRSEPPLAPRPAPPTPSPPPPVSSSNEVDIGITGSVRVVRGHRALLSRKAQIDALKRKIAKKAQIDDPNAPNNGPKE